MKRLFLGTIVSGLVLFATPGFAQDREQGREGRYENRDEGYYKGHLFDRVREDVERVEANTHAFSADEFRLTRVKQELNEMHQSAANGRIEERRLDDVITAIEKVIADNRMPERDRMMLQEDVRHLRAYKEHNERYYPRG
ncbi:MAG: hypothetical protein JO307_05465 [Bryobacterales bacterium]|nr:hypothetical protein [Bryobacterales bacterium]MBV9398708.1 hypothetical protein [Bryobacterales bacterium]